MEVGNPLDNLVRFLNFRYSKKSSNMFILVSNDKGYKLQLTGKPYYLGTKKHFRKKGLKDKSINIACDDFIPGDILIQSIKNAERMGWINMSVLNYKN